MGESTYVSKRHKGCSRTLYNLHCVKIEIRAHSSIVKDSRTAVKFCLANERVVVQRTEAVLLLVVVVGSSMVPLSHFALLFSNN